MKKLIYLLSCSLFSLGLLKSQPIITALSAASGSVGSTVIISGSNFNTTASLNTVYFGATRALVNNAGASSLTVTVPLGANNFPLSVLNTGSSLTAYSHHVFQNSFYCPYTLSPSSLSGALSFSTGQNTAITVGDFDGDGKSDMAVCLTTGNTNGTVSVYRNTSVSGTITGTSFGNRQDYNVLYPVGIRAIDMNNDGKLDLVTCNYSNGNVSVLKNTTIATGTISFDTPYTIPVGGGFFDPIALAIDDLDDDGKPDIVTADNSPGRISVIKNNSTPGALLFAASVEYFANAQPYGVSIADFDGDGKKDIAAVNSYSGFCVYRNTTSGGTITPASFSTSVDFTSSITPHGIGAADLDGDGKTDIVISGLTIGAIEIYRNTASPGIINATTFASPVSYTNTTGSVALTVSDVNGDGKPEILVPTLSNSSVTIFQNQSTAGSINFSLKISYAAGSTQNQVAVGDIDNDGKNDLLVTSVGGQSVKFLRNQMGLGSSAIVTSVSCNGGADGQIQLYAPIQNTSSILWSNAASTYTLGNLSAGLYQYTISSGTCSLTQSITIPEPAPLNINVSTSHTLLCEGETATLTANGAGSYLWNTSATGPSISITPAMTSTYLVTGTFNGCINTATITQAVSVFTLNVSSGSNLICEGETTTLSADGAQTYTWAGLGTAASLTVNPTVSTIYTVTGQNNDGCSKTSTLNVDVSTCTNTKNLKNDAVAFRLFPNPNKGQFSVEKNDVNEELSLEIFTTLGQCIYKKELKKQVSCISLSEYPGGIYLVKISSRNKIQFVRMIIE